MTPIEKFDRAIADVGSAHFDGVSHEAKALNAMIDLMPAFRELWQAANGYNWERGSIARLRDALDALNAKAAEVLP